MLLSSIPQVYEDNAKISGSIRLIVWLLQIYNRSYIVITGVSIFEIGLRSKL